MGNHLQSFCEATSLCEIITKANLKEKLSHDNEDCTFLCLLGVFYVQAKHIPGTDDVSDRNDDNGWDQSKFEEAEEQLLDANNEVNGALQIILDLVIKAATKWISQFQ